MIRITETVDRRRGTRYIERTKKMFEISRNWSYLGRLPLIVNETLGNLWKKQKQRFLPKVYPGVHPKVFFYDIQLFLVSFDGGRGGEGWKGRQKPEILSCFSESNGLVKDLA